MFYHSLDRYYNINNILAVAHKKASCVTHGMRGIQLQAELFYLFLICIYTIFNYLSIIIVHCFYLKKKCFASGFSEV